MREGGGWVWFADDGPPQGMKRRNTRQLKTLQFVKSSKRLCAIKGGGLVLPSSAGYNRRWAFRRWRTLGTSWWLVVEPAITAESAGWGGGKRASGGCLAARLLLAIGCRRHSRRSDPTH